MQRMMLVVVLVGVLMSATLPYAGAFRCYSCMGSTSSIPQAGYNKYCTKEKFDRYKVDYSYGNSVCMYMVDDVEGTKVTVRGGDMDPYQKMFEKFQKSEKYGTLYINFYGYACYSDLCNSNTAPNTRSLSLLLLLVPVLASLLRCFA